MIRDMSNSFAELAKACDVSAIEASNAFKSLKRFSSLTFSEELKHLHFKLNKDREYIEVMESMIEYFKKSKQ